MSTRDEVRVSLKVAGQFHHDVPFMDALLLIWRASVSNKAVYDDYFTMVKNDPWLLSLAGSISNALSSADQPTEADWMMPQTYIQAAQRDYSHGNIRGAIDLMESAVKACNSAHEKVQRVFSLQKEGAERGIVLVEIICTSVVLGGVMAVGEVGVGLGRAAQVALKVGLAPALKTGQKIEIEVGKWYFDAEKKVDWASVGETCLKEFVASIVGGALAAPFKTLLAPRLPSLLRIPEQKLVEKLARLYDIELKLAMPAAETLNKAGEKVVENVAQIAAVVILGTIQRIIERHKSEKLTVKDLLCRVLDDWGNEEIQIVAKALKILPDFGRDASKPAGGSGAQPAAAD